MFQKRIIELFTFIVYWLVFVPYAHEYAKERKWLSLDLNQFSEVVSKYAVFLVAMIVVYMIVYRIILWIYMKCKILDIQMFNNLKQMRIDPENALSRDDLNKSVTTLDQAYQVLSTVDEVDAKRTRAQQGSMRQKQKTALGPISSPLPQHRLLARTNSGFVADTLPAVHTMIRPTNVNTSEYCIRKPAPPPPPATPKAAHKAISMNPSAPPATPKALHKAMSMDPLPSPATPKAPHKMISMDPRPDLIRNAVVHSKSTPTTPLYGARKQFVLPPLPIGRLT